MMQKYRFSNMFRDEQTPVGNSSALTFIKLRNIHFLKRKSLKFIAEDLSNKNIVAYKNIEARIPLVGFYVL